MNSLWRPCRKKLFCKNCFVFYLVLYDSYIIFLLFETSLFYFENYCEIGLGYWSMNFDFGNREMLQYRCLENNSNFHLNGNHTRGKIFSVIYLTVYDSCIHVIFYFWGRVCSILKFDMIIGIAISIFRK